MKVLALLEGEILCAESPARFTEVVADVVREYDDYRWFMAGLNADDLTGEVYRAPGGLLVVNQGRY